jgi:hypothetical protein
MMVIYDRDKNAALKKGSFTTIMGVLEFFCSHINFQNPNPMQMD